MDPGVVISCICRCPDFSMSHAPTSIIMADGCDNHVEGTYFVFSTSYYISDKIKLDTRQYCGHFDILLVFQQCVVVSN